MKNSFVTLDFQASFCFAQLLQQTLHKTYSKVKWENENFHNSLNFPESVHLRTEQEPTKPSQLEWLLAAQRGKKLPPLLMRNVISMVKLSQI